MITEKPHVVFGQKSYSGELEKRIYFTFQYFLCTSFNLLNQLIDNSINLLLESLNVARM